MVKSVMKTAGQQSFVESSAIRRDKGGTGERRATEDVLRRSEERFRRAVYAAPFPVMIHAEGGQVLTVNRAWTEITGYTHDDMPTIEAWTEKAYGEKAAYVRDYIARLYDLDGRSSERDFVIRTASGEERTWHFSSSSLGPDVDGRRICISMAADITARKSLEAEIVRAAQLSLIGELAAGLAHEIKNPLAGIKGAVDILIQRRQPNDPEIEVLEDVRHAVERVDMTVRALLERARPRPLQPANASLTEVAQRAVLLSRHHVANTSMRGRLVKVSFEPTTDRVYANIDAAQIEDAVLNLIANGIEAVEGKGGVTVRVRRQQTKDAERKDSGRATEAVVEIEDTGRGISPENLAHIFNPFFTTTTGGTGLGLTAVQRIAQAHGGRVEVCSSPGCGSTFSICLPLSDCAPDYT